MKKFIFKLFIVLSIIFILSSCANINECLSDNSYYSYAQGHPEANFIIIGRGISTYVVYNEKTKVIYSISDGSYSHGIMTELHDDQGNPLLYDIN